jgi:hypothetical protein
MPRRLPLVSLFLSGGGGRGIRWDLGGFEVGADVALLMRMTRPNL